MCNPKLNVPALRWQQQHYSIKKGKTINSSVYMGILSQTFTPIFTPLGPLFPKPDHFSKSLKHLKKTHLDISYNPFIT